MGDIPSLLGELHSTKQNIEIWLSKPVMKKRPVADFTARWRSRLEQAVEDPDALRGRGGLRS